MSHADVRVMTLLLVAYGASAAGPEDVGEWSDVLPMEVVAIHAHHLPTGKVLCWDTHADHPPDMPDSGSPRLWDPATGTVSPAAMLGYDTFCSGHAYLGDGRLFVAGGHIVNQEGVANASVYDPWTDSWTAAPMMNAGRWYPTSTTLANGDVLVVAGSYWDGTLNANQTHHIADNTLPQVYDAAQNTWRDLEGAVLANPALPLYPWMFLAPNGKVFQAGPNRQARYLDTLGAGRWENIATSIHLHEDYGSAVMYDEGKVLIVGGAQFPPTATAEVIDLGAAQPAWRDVAPMAYARRHLTATLLPDGRVLVTGGTSAAGFNAVSGAVLAAEIWDPTTESWATLATMQTPRLYHSTATLLADGRVLVAGGGHPGATGDTVDGHPDAEVYSPPYLFRGPRPVISEVPAAVGLGDNFFVATPDAAAIGKVTWIALASVTHAINMNQRINRLGFEVVPGGLLVTTPATSRLAPPGPYLLFLLNTDGVPSLGKMVQASCPPPSVTISGPTKVCRGESATLDAGSGFASYRWSTGETTKTVAVSPEVPTTYYVEVTDARGCEATASVVVNPSYRLTTEVSPPSAGSVLVDPAPDCVQAAEYSFGTEVSIHAQAAGAYPFQFWSGDGGGVANPLTVTMVGARTVTANFAKSVRSEEDSARVAWNGWAATADAIASGGAYRRSATAKDAITFRFKAPAVTWVSRRGPDQGKASVSIDGKLRGSFDLYAPAEQTGAALAFGGLGNVKHSLVIKVLGRKNPTSIGTAVALDALVAGGSTTQENALAVQLGSWVGAAETQASGGTYRVSSTAGASARFTFEGTTVSWITASGPKYGKARVGIDGVDKGTFDLYTPGTAWTYARTFAGLSAGAHEIKVEVLGTRNPKAAGSAVVVDAFESSL